jgi:large subunit ribosomal protein L6
MSRIGQSPISFSDEVEVSLDEKNLKVKGPKGELFLEISKKINVDIDNKVIKIVNNDNSKQGKAVWGTTRSLVNNMVVGVTKGFSKNMEIVGVGYRGSLNGKVLTLNLGLSHTVEMNIPEGIEIKMDGNTKFSISGVDKQKIGQFASVVRSKRPPEPFKGKGVRYADEYVVRKEGKKK